MHFKNDKVMFIADPNYQGWTCWSHHNHNITATDGGHVRHITISIRLLTFLLILEVESLQFLNIQFFVTCKRNVLHVTKTDIIQCRFFFLLLIIHQFHSRVEWSGLFRMNKPTNLEMKFTVPTKRQYRII